MRKFGSALQFLAAGVSLISVAATAQTSPHTSKQAAPSEGDSVASENEEIIVLGSRIPRILKEGPAPVTVIDADMIRANGYTSVPDVLRAVTQNGGETQSQQSSSGASFTPGAAQVDLRGLGPNHTLVLVNGRRIADFPLPFKGRSNFTDVSNIPLGLIERVEILSGSASAVYGSDAIAGVVNFTLKKKADGTTIDYRFGNSERGGSASHRLTLTTGWSKDDFNILFGAELSYQQPLSQSKRKIQDSTADNPTTDNPVARRTFLRYDPVEDVYVDPGAAQCATLASLNFGTTYYGARPNWGLDGEDGRYCGSNESVAFGTIISQRKSLNSFTSLNYQIGDNTELFADIQFGISKVALLRDVQTWEYQDENGGSGGIFFNQATGALDSWSRQFTPEEAGGFGSSKTRSKQTTFTFTPGIKGSFADKAWSYELAYSHSEYRSTVKFPQIVAGKANALFLGPKLGTDDDGYDIFNAPVSRLYKPLTRAEYDSIATYSVYRPKSRSDNFSAQLNTQSLFTLPAGPVGLALSAEYGTQGYNLRPDPLALTDYYYSLKDSDGKGSRSHFGAGYEVRIPIFEMLSVSTAGRYDRYRFGGNSSGKFTYNGGVEFRPATNLLVRGAYGTGFRAPDLHYVFSGPGNTEQSGTDYLTCRQETPGAGYSDCEDYDEGILAHRNGNRKLRPETSKSLNFGVVWQPFKFFDFSVDYFRVSLANQVQDMSIDAILRDEADCRLGNKPNGTAVDINSPTCKDAIARVERAASGVNAGQLIGAFINPVNIAKEKTSGADVTARFQIPTDIGKFTLRMAYTYVDKHDFQQYPGDPIENKLAKDSGYYIPRDKGTASLTWAKDGWTATIEGQRLSKLPNYDEDAFIRASYLFNASAQYNISDHAQVSVSVDNLFDAKPVKDKTYSAYPYYDISWFDSIGRSFYLQLTYKFGGSPL